MLICRAPRRFLSLKPGATLPLACVFALVTAHLPGAEPSAPSDAACVECHSDSNLSLKRGGRVVSLFVDRAVVATSAHA